QIDPNTASFILRAQLPNTGDQLYPGELARVRVEVGVSTNALVVPTAAVQRGPDGNDYVWRVTDTPPPGARPGRGKPAHYVQMQAVTTGKEAGPSGLIVTQGLEDGDLVVTAGQFRLKNGSMVTTLKPGEVPVPPTTEEIEAAAQRSSR